MASRQKNTILDESAAAKGGNAYRKVKRISFRDNNQESPYRRIPVLQVDGVVPSSLRRQ
jgi:hypothetical protein